MREESAFYKRYSFWLWTAVVALTTAIPQALYGFLDMPALSMYVLCFSLGALGSLVIWKIRWHRRPWEDAIERLDEGPQGPQGFQGFSGFFQSIGCSGAPHGFGSPPAGPAGPKVRP